MLLFDISTLRMLLIVLSWGKQNIVHERKPALLTYLVWTRMKLRRELKKSVGTYLFSYSIIDKMNLTQRGNL